MPSGSIPASRFESMKSFVTFPSPLSGSIPVKLFSPIKKEVTANIARRPPSGSAPAKWFS
eukprot:4782169-Amphidinium_carterae.1